MTDAFGGGGGSNDCKSVQVLKKAVFAFLAVYIVNPQLQCLIAQSVLVICTVIHFMAMPFVYGGIRARTRTHTRARSVFPTRDACRA